MTKLVYPSLAGAEQNFAMLDLIPDAHAWVKDRHGHFVYGNRLFFERFGFNTLQGLLGKCDFDIAPPYLAEKYVSDDALVLGGGEVSDRLELILGEGGSGDWFLTSKWPIYDTRDRILGSLGISRHLNRTDRTAIPFRELRAPENHPPLSSFCPTVRASSVSWRAPVALSTMSSFSARRAMVDPVGAVHLTSPEKAKRRSRAVPVTGGLSP